MAEDSLYVKIQSKGFLYWLSSFKINRDEFKITETNSIDKKYNKIFVKKIHLLSDKDKDIDNDKITKIIPHLIKLGSYNNLRDEYKKKYLKYKQKYISLKKLIFKNPNI